MKNFRLPGIILMAGIILSSCGKYDDGPLFSIYSKTERVAGYWRFDKVIEGGVDKTEEYIQQSIQFYRDGSTFWVKGYKNNPPYDQIIQNGIWSFRSDKENLLIRFNIGLPEEYELDWKIKRLAYGDMRLERFDDIHGKVEWRLWKR